MSLKIASIDDEPYISDQIFELITQNFKDFTIVGSAASVSKGLELITNETPDLLFLDIQIEEGTGFDLIEQLDVIDFQIIFVTGYENKAIQAIRVGALDYILKPIEPKELINAVNKAVETNSQNFYKDSNTVALDYYQNNTQKTIVLKTLDAIHLVKIKDIVYCKSEGNYTTFYLLTGDHIMISRPLKHAVELLPDPLFVRCHRSYIVNVNHVDRIVRSGSVFMKNQEEILISSVRKDEVIKEIMNKMK